VLKKQIECLNARAMYLNLTRQMNCCLLFYASFNVHSALVSFKVVNMLSGCQTLDPDEMPSYSASHQDPSCLHIALWL